MKNLYFLTLAYLALIPLFFWWFGMFVFLHTFWIIGKIKEHHKKQLLTHKKLSYENNI